MSAKGWQYVASSLMIVGLLYLFWFGGDSTSAYVIVHALVGSLVLLPGLGIVLWLHLRRHK